ncbi:hypothetical protein [Nostoc sp.]|uniref:hypothetical protein n=1 Tax=Nostoc sp. TaxID=1180 RepID=UPI002FF60409
MKVRCISDAKGGKLRISTIRRVREAIAIAPVPEHGSDTVLRCDRLLQEVKYS